MDESTPWRNLGGIGLRFIDLVVRYAITFVVTLAALEAPLPADMRSVKDWPGLFVLIGVPSILISFAYGLASTRTGAAFRGRLAGLLFLPLWFLPFLGMPLIPVMGQLFFGLCVMRVPLLGPSQLRRQGRVALTAAVRGISRSSP
ncbi:hypothetical protein [Streptomyces sp. NBC_01727]|uniref:hypothetical protein n=1 Tax=Streptomyces sp. NBC_01727 TaxID=2975924 RepID=UPI002E12F0E9|nr:hypothetical protein OIE76_05695 [Streptomyces sp. NBC_01727]